MGRRLNDVFCCVIIIFSYFNVNDIFFLILVFLCRLSRNYLNSGVGLLLFFDFFLDDFVVVYIGCVVEVFRVGCFFLC